MKLSERYPSDDVGIRADTRSGVTATATMDIVPPLCAVQSPAIAKTGNNVMYNRP